MRSSQWISGIAGAAAVAALGLPAVSAGAPATCGSTGSPAAPTASTQPAAAVKGTTATLRATLDPGGCPTQYHFEYGTTAAYGSTSTTRTTGAVARSITVSDPLTGLSPDTTYHYRIDATSQAGTVDGSDTTFTTPSACAAGTSAAPTVTEAAADVTASAHAVLTGTVDPGGCSTQYHFEYGPTTAYGSQTSGRAVGAGTSAEPVRGTLSGLAPNSTYHFRLVATSVAGVTDGADMTFTTKTACAANASPRPAVRTISAVVVTSTNATLTGTVAPNGCTTSYEFQYGRTTAYGSVTPTGRLGAGDGSTAVRRGIVGLTPGRRYHFRLVATSAAGVSIGNDVRITTRLGKPSPVRLDGELVKVKRGGLAAPRLDCGGGTRRCRGVIRLFSGRRQIGRSRFTIRPDGSRVVAIRLSRQGRALIGQRRRAPVEVVITGEYRLRRRAYLTDR